MPVAQPTIAQGTPFVPRLSKPEAGNKYYITKSKGGYSDAVVGKPTDRSCNVLANCVGYAYGRFNEIGGYGECRYLRPTNAENFIENAGGLQIGQEPRLGACMVWRKGATLSGKDGAGHVAIVEKVISPTEVVTSESGWESSAFWTQTRKKGNGNWGSGSAYHFRGFIYNPAVTTDAYVVDGGGLIGATSLSYSSRPLTFADLGIDESQVNPFIVTIDPSLTSIDFESLKFLRVSGAMLYAGQKFNAGTYTRRSVFRAPNLKKQVELCQNSNILFALYTNVLARNISEAKEELQQLYYTASRYPPGLGLWLALKFKNQNKITNNAILEEYYKRLTEYGLMNGCGLYVTEPQLESIDWDTFKDRFQLWLIKDCKTKQEADSVGIQVEPDFFKIGTEARDSWEYVPPIVNSGLTLDMLSATTYTGNGSNSSLVSYVLLSPHNSGTRKNNIDTVTIHCMAGDLSIETCGQLFQTKEASSNYGIGSDGRIGMYVEESKTSWCTSNQANDNRAVTIEVASSAKHPYEVSSQAYSALILLITDICRRNNIAKLVWSNNKEDRIWHRNGCNMTVHRDYANKSCPGDYLYERHGAIAEAVNQLLSVNTRRV